MRNPRWLIPLLLIVAILAVYSQVYRFDFVNYDDPWIITQNPHLSGGLTFENIRWAFTDSSYDWWHPLTWLSHMVDCQLFGLNPGPHHWTNLLLHLANALLLFGVLQRMTGSAWRSGFVAFLFALHPIHVESVAWVTERKDVLSTLFLMLTLWSYWFYVQRPGAGRYMLIVFWFAMGLMAKPMLVTLPFALVLLDYWPLRRLNEIPMRQMLGEKIPLLVLSLASSVLTVIGQRNVGGVSSMTELSFGNRVANALVSYVGYLRKMIWPSDLAVFYPYPRFIPAWKVAAAALVLVAVSAAVFGLARRHRYLLVGWLWYLGTLVPVIGLVQVGDRAMADRFAYVPFIGAYIMLAWSAPEMFPKHLRLGVSLALCAIAFCMVAAWFQVGRWRNGITLFEHAIRVTENNSLAHYNLGLALADKRRFAEAIEHYSEAIRIKPRYADAENNLGLALAAQNKRDLALVHYIRALEIDPNHARALNNMGAALAGQGKMEEAIALYSRALQLRPYFAEAHNNLGFALAAQGKQAEAIVHYAEALRIQPNDAEGHNNLGVALAQQGRLPEAVAQFSEALRLKPDYAKARQNLALALAQQERATALPQSSQGHPR